MAKVKTTIFDVAEYLKDDEELMDLYLEEAFKSRETNFILACIDDVARAKGMAGITEEAGLKNETTGTNVSPSFATILKVLDSLGITLTPSSKVTT
ncbi:MAG: putative addiction module antidote protein [Spirochaetaceae bacterium]|nr:putative addiction module antidote protein [Spirochaetaceae bacterium]